MGGRDYVSFRGWLRGKKLREELRGISNVEVVIEHPVLVIKARESLEKVGKRERGGRKERRTEMS